MKTKEQKKEEAVERAAHYSSLTLSQKLELIEKRPGQSKREHLRLMKRDKDEQH